MSLKTRIKCIINKLEDLIFTNHACLVCRKEIPDGTKFSLCKNCLESLNKIDGNLCKICGEKIASENQICDRCKDIKFDFESSKSFAVYDEVASKIVKRFKYNGKKYYAEYIAKLMFENKNYFENFDYLVFVPIGEKRRKERGFNQAEEIAKHLSNLANIPVISVLEKIGNERHQAGLSQKERRQNLSGTISLNGELKTLIKNKRLILIDDVFTTGATLSECSKILKLAKPKKICCYTFAKTMLNSTNNG